MKFLEFTTQVSEVPNFLKFRQQSNNLGTFPIGSGLKRVAAGSVSERCQTSFWAQFSKNIYLESEKFFFGLICEISNIQKAPSKITRYGVNLQRENVFADSHVGGKPEKDPKTKMK